MDNRPLPRRILPALYFLFFNAAVVIFLRPVYQSPDGVGYFAYLWSIFSEKTLSFAAVYERYHMVMPLARTSTGWLANNWAFGTAMLWWPFYQAGQISRFFFGSGAMTMREALCLANFGSMAFGAACLGLLYASLKAWGRIPYQRLTVFLTLVGSPLFYYSFVDTTYAHAATAFASGLFLWYWLKTDKDSTPLRWGTLGLLAGVAACVRTQEVLIVLAPAWEWAMRYRDQPQQRPLTWKLAALLAAGFAVGFSPQAFVWKGLYGSFLAAPAAFNLSWSNFALWETLFSSYHGLFTWTPLFLIAIVGLAWEGTKGDRRAWILLAILSGQILINSFSVAWWGGLAFGLRQITGTCLIAGLGVGCFFKRCDERSAHWLYDGLGVACACAFWTALLALRGYGGTLDMLFYVSPRTLAGEGAGLKPALQALGSIQKNRSAVPFELFSMWFTAEILVGAIFWRCFKSTRWLMACLTALVLFADLSIYQSCAGVPPEFPVGKYIDASQLGAFFKYETYAVRALYHFQRGELVDSQRYFALADTTLPVSPATEPWRQQLNQWRSGKTP